ncbi:MAG: nucleoside deaminase [Desulfobulbaceae bacterium]|nr:nucleoside deaminase [Desulfobulbaceae bacterium]
MIDRQLTWDEQHMSEALAEARAALEAGEFPVGCVIARGDRIMAGGRRINSRGETANELDHAEISTLRLFLSGHPEVSPGEVTVYATMEPCLMCYTTMLLNGIRRIVYGYEDAMGGGIGLDLSGLAPLYREMRVEIVPRLRRAECLALFREFFSNADHDYWRGSPLAEYTLRQS